VHSLESDASGEWVQQCHWTLTCNVPSLVQAAANAAKTPSTSASRALDFMAGGREGAGGRGARCGGPLETRRFGLRQADLTSEQTK
jgi:hypothetical protein